MAENGCKKIGSGKEEWTQEAWPANYDEREWAQEHIAPLLNQIVDLCKIKGLPFMATLGVAAKNDGEDYATGDVCAFPEGRTPENFETIWSGIQDPTTVCLKSGCPVKRLTKVLDESRVIQSAVIAIDPAEMAAFQAGDDEALTRIIRAGVEKSGIFPPSKNDKPL